MSPALGANVTEPNPRRQQTLSPELLGHLPRIQKHREFYALASQKNEIRDRIFDSLLERMQNSKAGLPIRELIDPWFNLWVVNIFKWFEIQINILKSMMVRVCSCLKQSWVWLLRDCTGSIHQTSIRWTFPCQSCSIETHCKHTALTLEHSIARQPQKCTKYSIITMSLYLFAPKFLPNLVLKMF